MIRRHAVQLTPESNVMLDGGRLVSAIQRFGMLSRTAARKLLAGPFHGPRARHHVFAWLKRSEKQQIKRVSFACGMPAVLQTIAGLVLICGLPIMGLPWLLETFELRSRTWYPGDLIVVLGTVTLICASVFASVKWMFFLQESADGPLSNPHAFLRIQDISTFMVGRSQKTMLGPTLSFLADDSHAFMSHVRRQLGDADAQAFVLMMALPDEPDAPRAGDAEELVSRVAEVAHEVLEAKRR